MRGVHVAALLAVAISIALPGCSKHEDELEQKPVVAVKVARAELSDLAQTVVAPATVFPREQANLSARIMAPNRELRARKGDTVRAGQVLAILENRDVAAQQREAQASLEDAQATLQKLTSGTLPTDVERARGQMIAAQAALNQAEKILEKRKQLFGQGAIPQRDLLLSETELATAKANYDVARMAYESLQNRSREQDIKIAQSRVAQAQARLQGSNANIQFSEIRSPFAGVITEQFQYPGDMAQPSAPVYTVMDLSAVTARAQVPESDAAKVSRGQSCSFSAADGGTFSGRVTVVSRAVDPQRRTVEVWCETQHPPAAVRAGLFGTASIVTGAIRAAVIVPITAVQLEEGTRKGVALTVDAQHVAHRREIEAGDRSGEKLQIVAGLKGGELVVIEGGYGLADGARVQLPGESKAAEKK